MLKLLKLPFSLSDLNRFSFNRGHPMETNGLKPELVCFLFVSGSHKDLNISTDCNIMSLCGDGGHIFERNGWIVGVIMVAATF